MAVEVTHEPDQKRYAGYVDGTLAGYAAYVDQADARNFNHTVTLPEFGGRGVAGEVVRFALEDTITGGQKIVPTCSYVQHFIEKHPEYKDKLK